MDHYDKFWEEFWHYSNLVYSKKFSQVVDTKKNISEIPEWFSESRLNFAENLLQGEEERIAIYEAGEGKNPTKMTYGELRSRVARIAHCLKESGVQIGDRVVGYIPNCSLAIEVMLATASLGAIWSSTSPEFGVSGVLDRFQQIKPKVIFSVDAVTYNGKVHDHMEKLKQVVEGLPELERVVVHSYVRKEEDCDISLISKSMFLSKFLEGSHDDQKLNFVQVPFNHPLYIMYSSGTTGPPKCMVHSAGVSLYFDLIVLVEVPTIDYNDTVLCW